MRPFLLSPVFAALLLIAEVTGSHAQVLYNNGGPGGSHASEITRYIEADDFELTEATRLDRAQFWTAESPGSFAGSFTWQIFRNANDDEPGQLVASGTSTNLSRWVTGSPVLGGYPEYVNTFDFGPVVLPPGIYWLALHNGPLTNFLQPLSSCFWENTTGIGERPSHGAVGPFYNSWFSNQYLNYPAELAFNVGGISLPRITELRFDGPTALISFTSAAGEQYRVEYTNSLTAPSWATLPGSEVLAGTGGIVQVNDPQPDVRSLPRRFYRVVLL